jgi:hypothetical protein
MLLVRERVLSEVIGEAIREGDLAFLRKHMKNPSQVSPRYVFFTLKRSLSTGCVFLLKQLIRVGDEFERWFNAVSHRPNML